MIGSGSPWNELAASPIPGRRHRERYGSGWESLTATEAGIVTHITDGLSNPEIAAKLLVSRRTVATHVEHILSKLELRSRTEIAREAALLTAEARRLALC